MKKLKKNRSKFLILTLVSTMFLLGGCSSNSNINNQEDSNKTNNNVIEEDNNTNNTITSDHITNDKVQEIYDVVKLGTSINSLSDKISLAFNKVNVSQFSREQLNYIEKTYYSKGQYINTEIGYYSVDNVLNQLNNIFNITVSEEQIISDFSSNNFLYDSSIKGFLSKSWPTGCSAPGECIYKKESVYNYVENSNEAIVDTIIAYTTNNKGFYQSNNVDKIYKDKNRDYLIYENIDLDTFEFSEEDKNKFTKLRYTFNKRDDGTYYFANVEAIN